jgi:hypothetical protein
LKTAESEKFKAIEEEREKSKEQFPEIVKEAVAPFDEGR